MTGNDLKDLLKFHGLNQKEASEELKICEMTISRSINREDEDISSNVAKKALEYSLNESQKQRLGVEVRMLDIWNRLYYINNIAGKK